MTDRPELCVAAIAVSEGRLLLVQRGTPPGHGRWSLPGGRVEGGELLAAAVVRELAEETNVEGVCGRLIGWAERFHEEGHVVILDFEVTVLDHQEPQAGDDAMGAAWVALEEVADLDLVDGLAHFLHENGVIDTIA
ncbi:MAG: NUDIX hydrolase [Acidimicrobiales bacterium]